MKYKLEELFDLQMGKTPSRNNNDYWNIGDNKWISIGDLSTVGKYIFNTKEQLSDLAIRESGIKSIPVNTVVMSFKLSIGKVAITAEDMYSNEAIMAFHDKKVTTLLPDYIYYLFLYQDWDVGTNKAVMGKTLNKATLSKYEIDIHSIEEQHRIVKTLDKISVIIENQQKELDMLDTLIKARFVEIFGDPEHNTKNWPVVKLEKLCDVGSSKRIYQNEQSTTGIPFLRISDLVDRMDRGSIDCDLYIPNERYEQLKEQGLVPKVGDILVTARGTLGRCYIIAEDDEFYFQDGMITWLSKLDDLITPLYISYLFSMSGFRKQIDNLQNGSTIAYLSISMTKKLDIMVPSIEIQEQFINFVRQIEKSKAAVQKSLDETQLLFDSLMQQYFG